jgi:formylmethanofuran dehydrogenase subunit C
MKNPFRDFRSFHYQKKEIPLERIVRAKREVMDHMLEGYLRLVEAEAKELVWLVEHSRVVKAYSAAVKSIQELKYDQDDIEEFCDELDSSNKISYMISGPAGIYLSALINQSQEDRIVLRLKDYQKTFHFIGYRLPDTKTLLLQGNVGDFTGANLNGGRLVVEGAAGNWCGAGMIKGEILVTESTGRNTGEWMRGGEIHVDGWIRGLGKTALRGRIYERGKLIVPKQPDTHA